MNVKDLVDKYMHDSAFRSGLQNDPEGTLRGAGVNPTPEMLNAVKNVDHGSLKAVADSFDPFDPGGISC